MRDQDFILKKYVRASSASEAIKLDKKTPVSEVFLVADKPVTGDAHAIGFAIPPGDDRVPYEAQRGR